MPVPIQGLVDLWLKSQDKETRMKYSKGEMWLEERTIKMQEPILTLCILRVHPETYIRSRIPAIMMSTHLGYEYISCKEYVWCSSEINFPSPSPLFLGLRTKQKEVRGLHLG